MPNPKRRHSNARTRKRRTHDKIRPVGVSLCPQCGAEKRPHHICQECGYYKGKPMITIEQAAAKKTK